MLTFSNTGVFFQRYFKILSSILTFNILELHLANIIIHSCLSKRIFKNSQLILKIILQRYSNFQFNYFFSFSHYRCIYMIYKHVNMMPQYSLHRISQTCIQIKPCDHEQYSHNFNCFNLLALNIILATRIATGGRQGGFTLLPLLSGKSY